MSKKKKKSFFDSFFGLKKDKFKDEYYMDDEYNEEDDYMDDYEVEDEDGEYENEKEEEVVEEQRVENPIKIDLVETDEEYILAVPILGVSPDRVEVAITHELVTISYNFDGICAEIDGNFICKEIDTGYFSRSIMLPTEIDIDSSEAKSKNGILKVRLQKIDKKKKRKLHIKKD